MTQAPIATEALVIGAGPVGLFQVFQLGLQGIHCQVIDALPHVGGQCAELYAGKPIYDIPGIPFCTGQELVERLQQQIAPFKATLHLGQQVTHIERQADQRLAITTDAGQHFLTSTLFIAAGVGAFVPRRMVLDGLSVFEGTQVFAEHPAPERWAGLHLVVAGEGDTALQTCLDAMTGPQAAASVTLLHRRDQFSATPELTEQMRQACAQGRMRFVAGQPTGLKVEQGRLQALELLNPQGDTEWLPLDLLQTWEQARQHDPQMQVVQATRSSVQAYEAQAQSLWRPVVMGSATVGAMSAETRTTGAQFAVGGQTPMPGSFATSASAAMSTRWSLQAKQALYSPERQAQQAQLQQAAGVAEWRADLAHQQFLLQTVQRYFQVLLAERQQQVLKNQRVAVERSLTEARDRFAIGDLPVTDTHEAAARASGLQAQWLAADSDLQMARQVLAESTRLPIDALKPQAPPAHPPPRAAGVPHGRELGRCLGRRHTVNPLCTGSGPHA